jgi:hypothetical protein
MISYPRVRLLVGLSAGLLLGIALLGFWSQTMGYFALFYREVVPDFITRRAAFREEHLSLAREMHAHGELLLAGALADPPDGSLLYSKPPMSNRFKTL